MTDNEISNLIIGSAIEVHRDLGPGLLESAYQECLFYEISQQGLFVEKEKSLPVIYKEVKLDHGYRIDLFVERRVIVEIKTVDAFTDVHLAQVLTYMKLTDAKIGLLINFHVKMLKQGLKRVVR